MRSRGPDEGARLSLFPRALPVRLEESDMPAPDLVFQNVSFRYTATVDPLFTRLSFQVAPGWTGVVGANGAGKTTLLLLAAGGLVPANGRVSA